MARPSADGGDPARRGRPPDRSPAPGPRRPPDEGPRGARCCRRGPWPKASPGGTPRCPPSPPRTLRHRPRFLAERVPPSLHPAAPPPHPPRPERPRGRTGDMAAGIAPPVEASVSVMPPRSSRPKHPAALPSRLTGGIRAAALIAAVGLALTACEASGRSAPTSVAADQPSPLVDPSKIIGGGPPPDGIPPIDHPKFL